MIQKLSVAGGGVALAVAAYALQFPLLYGLAGLVVVYLFTSSCST